MDTKSNTGTMVGILAVIVGGLWLWNKNKAGAAPGTAYTCPVDGLSFATLAAYQAHYASAHTSAFTPTPVMPAPIISIPTPVVTTPAPVYYDNSGQVINPNNLPAGNNVSIGINQPAATVGTTPSGIKLATPYPAPPAAASNCPVPAANTGNAKVDAFLDDLKKRKPATPYTGAPALKTPAPVGVYAGMPQEASINAESVALQKNAYGTSGEFGLISAAERVRAAQAASGMTVYSTNAVIADMYPQSSDSDAVKLAKLAKYAPYGLPDELRALYNKLLADLAAGNLSNLVDPTTQVTVGSFDDMSEVVSAPQVDPMFDPANIIQTINPDGSWTFTHRT